MRKLCEVEKEIRDTNPDTERLDELHKELVEIAARYPHPTVEECWYE